MSAETFYEEPRLLDELISFDEDAASGDLIIQREQAIPTSWMSDLVKEKLDSVSTPCGDMYRVASIPVAVVDELQRRYGFDVMNAPVRETLGMLRRLHLDNFITTNKRI